MKRLITSLVALLYSLIPCLSQDVDIVDSCLTLQEALKGSAAPQEVLDQLVIVDVEYYGYDSLLHRGQVVCNEVVVDDIAEIFSFIKQEKYPVYKVVPVKFDLSGGDTSMDEMNYSSSFFYRKMVGGSKNLSRHALGMAIDLNPHQNPYFNSKGDTIPRGKHYNPLDNRALTSESAIVRKFISMGWIWGGNWQNPKDYMHFEKRL